MYKTSLVFSIFYHKRQFLYEMNVYWYVIKEKSSKDIDMRNERNGRDDNKHDQNINKINMEKSGHNTASSFIVAMTVCIIYL